jgi:hypothetical protein
LKFFAFELFESSENQFFHPLFTRDFPELWNLEHDEELSEKVVLCIFLDRKCHKVNESTGTVDESCDWEDYPPLLQIICEYTARFYRAFSLLSAAGRRTGKETKLVKKVFHNLVKELREYANSNGLEFAESFDDNMVITSLRKFFKRRLEKSRQKLMSLKMKSDSVEEKTAFHKLILQATSLKIEGTAEATDDMFPVVSKLSNSTTSGFPSARNQVVDNGVLRDILTIEDKSEPPVSVVGCPVGDNDRRSTQSSPSIVSSDSVQIYRNTEDKTNEGCDAVSTAIGRKLCVVDTEDKSDQSGIVAVAKRCQALTQDGKQVFFKNQSKNTKKAPTTKKKASTKGIVPSASTQNASEKAWKASIPKKRTSVKAKSKTPPSSGRKKRSTTSTKEQDNGLSISTSVTGEPNHPRTTNGYPHSTATGMVSPPMIRHNLSNIPTEDVHQQGNILAQQQQQHQHMYMSPSTNVAKIDSNPNLISTFPLPYLKVFVKECAENQHGGFGFTGNLNEALMSVNQASLRILEQQGLSPDDILSLSNPQRVELFCEIGLWSNDEHNALIQCREEIEIVDQVVPRVYHAEKDVLERLLRIECYITLLRMSDGVDWYRLYTATPLHMREIIVHQRIKDCLLSQEMQLFLHRYHPPPQSLHQQYQRQLSPGNQYLAGFVQHPPPNGGNNNPTMPYYGTSPVRPSPQSSPCNTGNHRRHHYDPPPPSSPVMVARHCSNYNGSLHHQQPHPAPPLSPAMAARLLSQYSHPNTNM